MAKLSTVFIVTTALLLPGAAQAIAEAEAVFVHSEGQTVNKDARTWKD